jgi:hypothetical protein
MDYEETLEDVAPEVEPDRSHVQILLRIANSLKSDAEAERIGRKRVPFVIVAASGFGEIGRDGNSRQQDLRQFLKGSESR